MKVDKIDFKPKLITRDKKNSFIVLKCLNHQEDFKIYMHLTTQKLILL